MINISLIKSITAVRKTGTGTDSTSIPFVSGSAVLKIEDKPTEHGARQDYRLELRIAGLNPATESMVALMRKANCFQVVDVSGGEYLIGGSEVRLKIAIDTHTGGRAGSFRGIAVTIDWSSV